MCGPSNPEAKEIPSEKYFSVIEKKIEQSKILKLQKSENFDFLKKYRYFLVLFFMIHGAARPNGNSYLVAADRRRLGFLGTLHD